jgi:hypothetical protein
MMNTLQLRIRMKFIWCVDYLCFYSINCFITNNTNTTTTVNMIDNLQLTIENDEKNYIIFDKQYGTKMKNIVCKWGHTTADAFVIFSLQLRINAKLVSDTI